MSAWADIYAFDIAAVERFEGEISLVKSPLLSGSWNAFAIYQHVRIGSVSMKL